MLEVTTINVNDVCELIAANADNPKVARQDCFRNLTPPNSGSGGTWVRVSGIRWLYVDQNRVSDYVAVTGVHGEDVLFVEGDEAHGDFEYGHEKSEDLMDMTPEEVIDWVRENLGLTAGIGEYGDVKGHNYESKRRL